MSSLPYNNQMASFWDFVADLEERGASHPWFGRRGGARGGANRAANRGEAAEGNDTEGPNPWTAGAAAFPFGPMPHRPRHGHGPGRQGGRRHQHNEAAAGKKETGVETPETEKVPELKTEKEPVEPLQSDAEKVESGNEGRRVPGARRGGRSGGVIAARRAFHREACGGDHLPRFCPKAKELDLFGPAFPPRNAAVAPNAKMPDARRGGPGGRGAGRGAGRGMGPGLGRGGGNIAARRAFHKEVCGGDHRPRSCPRSAELGLFRGPFERHAPAFGSQGSTPDSPRSGGIIPARRAFHKEMCGEDHRPRVCPRATELGLFRGPFERRGSASGPRGGASGARRGGPGAGRGRGRGVGLVGGQNAAPWARALQHEAGNGPHHGPGAGRGGPGGRGGRGGRGMGAGRGRGGHGPAGRHLNHGLNAAGPHGGPGGPGMRRFAAMFQDPTVNTTKNTGKFTPEVDVFDHAEAFVVLASLPGAKKEEIEVNWDSEKSMLTIAGNIARTGDEELLKATAVNERKVGAFERKIRLGSPANAAQVDVDDITAKMEDGVLKIEVPKLDSGFVEVKKVDIK